MKKKNYTEVLIDGKIYTLAGTEDEPYLRKVAGYISEKVMQMKKVNGYTRLSAEQQFVLMSINLADDYFKEQQRADLLEKQKAALEKEAYSLKHELVTMQVKLEKANSNESLSKNEGTQIQ